MRVGCLRREGGYGLKTSGGTAASTALRPSLGYRNTWKRVVTLATSVSLAVALIRQGTRGRGKPSKRMIRQSKRVGNGDNNRGPFVVQGSRDRLARGLLGEGEGGGKASVGGFEQFGSRQEWMPVQPSTVHCGHTRGTVHREVVSTYYYCM